MIPGSLHLFTAGPPGAGMASSDSGEEPIVPERPREITRTSLSAEDGVGGRKEEQRGKKEKAAGGGHWGEPSVWE